MRDTHNPASSVYRCNDIVPQRIRVIQRQRVKHACPCCGGSIKTPPAPPARVIPKRLLTESALAWSIKLADLERRQPM
ncbi:hypothetical protein DOT66_10665 [Ralstonia pseudosolanacearum]|uniref:hypothetical protein n=1 Tax=Ralstonia pseudosolanacearum TaxID=1310165 RepID=UPI000DAE1F26|nr:hypothetical protein [Ralstonia pseudosolanacearum]AZU55506.1 hypothetical protein CFM90_04185 [Ralstonia solanacearum]MCK4138083.1 hypothetical protein [Ralstonia pseudosolanacearum]RAA10239.1 hypothetical protein DOT66_10665 [Ralstonia pseudosolanacearum]UQY84354.1 hypothetical protein JNO62_05970 [Ralstonia pseudosolanacearum]